MAGEQGLAMLLEVFLIRIEHPVEPWQQLLGAMVGVKNDGDFVRGSDCADVVSSSDSTCDRSLLVLVSNTLGRVSAIISGPRSVLWTDLSCEVCSTTLGHLEDDGGFGIASGF